MFFIVGMNDVSSQATVKGSQIVKKVGLNSKIDVCAVDKQQLPLEFVNLLHTSIK